MRQQQRPVGRHQLLHERGRVIEQGEPERGWQQAGGWNGGRRGGAAESAREGPRERLSGHFRGRLARRGLQRQLGQCCAQQQRLPLAPDGQVYATRCGVQTVKARDGERSRQEASRWRRVDRMATGWPLGQQGGDGHVRFPGLAVTQGARARKAVGTDVRRSRGSSRPGALGQQGHGNALGGRWAVARQAPQGGCAGAHGCTRGGRCDGRRAGSLGRRRPFLRGHGAGRRRGRMAASQLGQHGLTNRAHRPAILPARMAQRHCGKALRSQTF